MGQAELQTRRYTPEEYFALEARSEMRHEYFEGEVFAMAGGSKTHNLLVQNAAGKIRASLRGSGCQVFASDVRLEAKEKLYYTYPDVVITYDPADHRDPYLVRYPRNEAGQWIYTLLTGPTTTLEISDMGLVLPLRELYEDTDVAPLLVLPGSERDDRDRF